MVKSVDGVNSTATRVSAMERAGDGPLRGDEIEALVASVHEFSARAGPLSHDVEVSKEAQKAAIQGFLAASGRP